MGICLSCKVLTKIKTLGILKNKKQTFFARASFFHFCCFRIASLDIKTSLQNDTICWKNAYSVSKRLTGNKLFVNCQNERDLFKWLLNRVNMVLNLVILCKYCVIINFFGEIFGRFYQFEYDEHPGVIKDCSEVTVCNILQNDRGSNHVSSDKVSPSRLFLLLVFHWLKSTIRVTTNNKRETRKTNRNYYRLNYRKNIYGKSGY